MKKMMVWVLLLLAGRLFAGVHTDVVRFKVSVVEAVVTTNYDIVVTGTGLTAVNSWSPNGGFTNAGTYNGTNYYREASGQNHAWVIWFDDGAGIWNMVDSSVAGSMFGADGGSFKRNNSEVGMYNNDSWYSGNPIATFGPGYGIVTNYVTNVVDVTVQDYVASATVATAVVANVAGYATVSGAASNWYGGTAIKSVSANYTNSVDDFTVLVNVGVSDVIVDLPAASVCSGKVFVIKRISGGVKALYIDPSGSETIDGALTNAIMQKYQAVIIQNDGSNWHIIGEVD